MSGKRSFLLLQGVCSPFFSNLAENLRTYGHTVHKVNFNAGDWLYWKSKAFNYREKISDLHSFLSKKYQELGVTDQLIFGDCRPIHRSALMSAKSQGVRTHVFEEGYFRPHWITLERDGVNNNSLLPRDPQWFLETGKRLPALENVRSFHTSFRTRAIHDIAYHSAGALNPLFFPKYRTHANFNAVKEYWGYARRLPMLRFHDKRDGELISNLIASSEPFFLLPLQLSSDAQILEHSSFNNMSEVIGMVMNSFARSAPVQARLVIKNHPLDTGLDNYAKIISDLSDRFCLKDRVDYIETGNLDALLQHAKGVVTVNSTVGAISLGFNCPTIALSNPIYSMTGLTFQGTLDDFWKYGDLPNARLFDSFRNTVIYATQVNGGFYTREGISLAVEGCLRRLESKLSPLEELL